MCQVFSFLCVFVVCLLCVYGAFVVCARKQHSKFVERGNRWSLGAVSEQDLDN